MTLSTTGFFDLDRDDDVAEPAYDGSDVPLRTYGRVELESETNQFSVGPFRLSAPRLDFGVFEDQSNPTNRSAAATPRVSGGRLLAGYTLSLEPLTPWTGPLACRRAATLSASTTRRKTRAAAVSA